jgi:hypothetical protein
MSVVNIAQAFIILSSGFHFSRFLGQCVSTQGAYHECCQCTVQYSPGVHHSKLFKIFGTVSPRVLTISVVNIAQAFIILSSTFHNFGDSVRLRVLTMSVVDVAQALIVPLLPEGDLDAVFLEAKQKFY